MRICGRDYKLVFRDKMRGAEYTDRDSDGRGLMLIGTKDWNVREVADLIVHESLEAILMEDFKRYTPNMNHISDVCDDTSRFLFVFDHDYLVGFSHKVLDALESSGFFKLADGRPKRKKKVSAKTEKVEI